MLLVGAPVWQSGIPCFVCITNALQFQGKSYYKYEKSMNNFGSVQGPIDVMQDG